MKIDKPANNETKLLRPKLKPILICGDDKGGVGKSTTVVHMGDALIKLGYKVRYADGDPANRTLSGMIPGADKVAGNSEDDIRDYVAGSAAGNHDITLLDMAGGTGNLLANVFGDGVQIFESDGVRVIVGLVVTQHPKSIKGIMNWIRAFVHSASFVGLANGKDSPQNHEFELSSIDGGEAIKTLCKNRVVKIPRFPTYIEPLYIKSPGPPSAYLLGGRLQAQRHFQRLAWQRQLDKVVQTLRPDVEWLTGMTPPSEHAAAPGPCAGEERAALETLEKLRVLYGDENK